MARQQDPPPRTAWTVPEVAESLGLSPREVYRLVERKELAAFHVGRRVLVPVPALSEYIAAALAAAS